MAKGGARPGAGRPKGSTYLNLREVLERRGKEDDKDYIAEFTAFLLANYMEDTKLMIWVGEHLFGKPVQPVEADVTGTLSLSFDNAFASQPKTDSGK
jgi:hypothetical protein